MNYPHVKDVIEIKKPTLANLSIFVTLLVGFVTLIAGGVRVLDRVDRISDVAVTKAELASVQTELLTKIEDIAQARTQALGTYQEEREQNRDTRQETATNTFNIQAMQKEAAKAEAGREAINQRIDRIVENWVLRSRRTARTSGCS